MGGEKTGGGRPLGEKLESQVVFPQEEVISETQEGVTILNELELPVEGDERDCTIVAIRVGKLGELINIENIRDESIREAMKERADRRAIQIACVIDDLKELVEDTIVISYHRNARYPEIAARYRKLKTGMKVKVKLKEGRWKVV